MRNYADLKLPVGWGKCEKWNKRISVKSDKENHVNERIAEQEGVANGTFQW